MVPQRRRDRDQIEPADPAAPAAAASPTAPVPVSQTPAPPAAPALTRRAARIPLRDARPEPPPFSEAAPQRSRHLGGWLLMAALVLAGWATTCFVDVAVPGFAAAAAFAPLLTVVAVPVMALGVSSRHLVPAGIAAIAAAVPWALVAGYASAGPGPTSARDGLTVTVMSVDAAGGQADAAAISRLARAYGPDVVVVSGLTSRFAHDLTVTGLNAAVTTRAVQISDGRTDGIGLWSRSPVSDVQPLPGLSRPAVRGVLRPGNAAPIGIVAAQASGTALAPDPGWSRELAELEDAGPDTEQQLIVGVKGAPWQPGFRQLTSGDWQDAADVAGHGLRPTWPSWSPMPVVPLDHVIVSGGLGVSAVDTAQIPGTAHRALIVSLVAQQAG